ncbi:MAG: hypothetical protein HY980_04035 [Candidatus Magasanikbacteria bacterium]|nr:hypothetical protein [Candidatus Magasanikbacteria bacterium]
MLNLRQQFEKYNSLPALTEWLNQINSPELSAFNYEDNTKFDRLETLNSVINLPYDKPESIEAIEVINNSPRFQEIMKRRANEHCAVRLTPYDTHKPRLRARGMSLRGYVNIWLPMQNIHFEQYRLDILPQNTDIIHSSIFLINEYGILGEIIRGVHWQLTQGVYEKEGPITYYFDFEKWFFSVLDEEIKIDPGQKLLNRALDMIIVADPEKQKALRDKLDAEFTPQGYLKGYFEFFLTPQKSVYYNDYNRLVYKKLKDFRLQINNTQAAIKGITASAGEAIGPARKIKSPKTENINKGDILVCKAITIDYLPLIEKAGAIITERGNLLSHTTIIARELKKPYIINAVNITQKVSDGQKILVDANSGSVYFV